MSSCVRAPARVVKVSFKGFHLDRRYVGFDRRIRSRERSCRCYQGTKVFQKFDSVVNPRSGQFLHI